MLISKAYGQTPVLVRLWLSFDDYRLTQAFAPTV
jgi:hypothetical protein